MKVTRRKLMESILSTAALPAAAQTPAPANPDYLAVSRDLNKSNAEALNKVAVPMPAEPAFQFKA